MDEETEDQGLSRSEILAVGPAAGTGALIESMMGFLDANQKADVVEIAAPDGTKAPAIVTRNGVTILDVAALDGYRDHPRYRDGTATLLDLDSFIEHAQRFLGNDSIVFADNNRDHPSLTSVIDYHTAGHSSAARWGRHRGRFAFPLSDEWRAWAEYDGKPMEMHVFARFIEDHITDVLDPYALASSLPEQQEKFVNLLGGTGRMASPAKLMEIATGLSVREEVETAQAVTLQTGESMVHFKNQQTGENTGEAKVPSMFAIGIPVFTNGTVYQIIARLRYRALGNGKVAFFYDLWRVDLVFDDAFQAACIKVSEATGLPVLLGSPEK